jgi:magnesium chelatase subunit D
MRVEYPFSAVVGEEDLKLALQLAAVDPTIGGVLIKGERGTAKSTVARGLAALLPTDKAGKPAPFVELPLGATEDRVVGSLDVGRALREGETHLRSGLLARAHGGILYVDEVNLLPDHLVDLLLDAAARGWVTVERDGVSTGEAASFMLIGTMNPEEGALRPQFVDRFGLCVQVQGLGSPELRAAALARRLAFDAGAARFVIQQRSQEDALREAIVSARARLSELQVTGEHLSKVTEIGIEQDLDGIRGDLAIIKAARALAAWQGAARIEEAHIRRASLLAVPHRLHRRADSRARRVPAGASSQQDLPASPPGLSPPQPGLSPPGLSAPGPPPPGPPPPQPQAPAPLPTQHAGALNLTVAAIDSNTAGRRGSGSTASRRAPRPEPYDATGALAVKETLTVAAARGARVQGDMLAVVSADLMQHRSEGAGHCSVLFVVDASGSMAVQRRLEVAKGAALAMLRSSYQHRDEVALMVFRGHGTDLVLPFTNDVERIESALRDVPTGGRTPLARALLDSSELLRARPKTILVLFTDGRANVGVTEPERADPWSEALAACGELTSLCSGALVVDCETGPIALGRARLLADALQGECIGLSELDAGDLTLHLQRKIGRS